MQRHSLIQAAVGLLVAGLAAGAAGQKLSPVPQDDVVRMEGLVGARLTVKPLKARRVLVFWRCEGFAHTQALAYGNKALEIAGTKTRAFEVDLSNDYEALKPVNLKKYDALVLNNTTGLKTHEMENLWLQPALLEFVRSGKGLAVIHGGADNFNRADAAAEMVGGFFTGHPWGAGGTWAFKLDDPKHVLNRAFGEKDFKFGDEIYQHASPPYNRAKLRVLVSMDFADEATRNANGQKRVDNDYAVSWIRPYGKGRVFYTSFGHDARAFLNPAVLQHILDGLQYVIGDLPADDTPAGLSEADLARVKAATLENNNEVYGFLQDILLHTHHEKVAAANKAKLDALLGDASVSVFGKKVLLRLMLSSGAPADLQPVFDCLADPTTRDWAAALLAGTPRREIDKRLIQKMSAGDPLMKCTMVKIFARRKNTSAVKLLANDPDATVAVTALSALGLLADAEALAVLRQKNADPQREAARIAALSACLGTMAQKGSRRKLVRAVSKMMMADKALPPAARSAAAKARLLIDGNFFAEGMKDGCPMVRATLIQAADDVKCAGLEAVLGQNATTPEDQVALIAKLAHRDKSCCARAIAKKLDSGQEAVACQALRALSKTGSAEQVAAMYAVIAKGGSFEAAAIAALNDMRAKGVAEALLEIAKADATQTRRVIAILGERMEAATLPAFETFVKSSDPEVRKETWKALGKIADETTFVRLLGWLSVVQAPEINQAEAALRGKAKNVDDDARTAALADAWGKNTAIGKRILAGMMPLYQDASFVALLKGALTDEDCELREAAIRALADWSDMTPFPILKQAVVEQGDTNLKRVALRSALKLASAQAGQGLTESCVELFRVVDNDNARLTVADALFQSEGFGLFSALQGLFADSVCGTAAKATYCQYFDQKLKPQVGVSVRELDPKGWKATASHNQRAVANAFDRNPATRWSSNAASVPGMWFTLDLGASEFITEVVLDTKQSGGDTPNGCEVFVSEDGKEWGGVVAKGDDTSTKDGITTIRMSARGRHIKIVTTGGRPGLFWSLHEIAVKSGLDEKMVEEIRKTAETLR